MGALAKKRIGSGIWKRGVAAALGIAVGAYAWFGYVSNYIRPDLFNPSTPGQQVVEFVTDGWTHLEEIVDSFNTDAYADDGSGLTITTPSAPGEHRLYVVQPSVVNNSFNKPITGFSEIPEDSLVMEGNGLFVGEESHVHWPVKPIGVGALENPKIISMVPALNYTLQEDTAIADPNKEPLVQVYPAGTQFSEAGKVPITFLSEIELGDSKSTYVSVYPIVEVSGLENMSQEVKMYPCVPPEILASDKAIDPAYDCSKLVDPTKDIDSQMKQLLRAREEAYQRIAAKYIRDGKLDTTASYTPPGKSSLTGEAAYLAELWANGIFFDNIPSGTGISLKYTPKTMVLLTAKPEVKIDNIMLGLADFKYQYAVLGIDDLLNRLEEESDYVKYQVSEHNKNVARNKILQLPSVLAIAINQYGKENPSLLVPFVQAGEANYSIDPGVYEEPGFIPDLVEVLNQNNADLILKYGLTHSPAALVTSDRACMGYGESCKIEQLPAELYLCVDPSLVDSVRDSVERHSQELLGSAYSVIKVDTIDSCVSAMTGQGIGH